MVSRQDSIFNMLYDNYKIKKPIRLIELFAGYGSQAFALDYLGANFEHWRTCEWAIKSIQAYKDAHLIEKTYECNMTKEELIAYFLENNISNDYNTPMNENQLKRKTEKQLQTIYSNMKVCNNLGSIVTAKAKDFNIVDKDKYEYIMTYSFPCQDLSMAGLRKGMEDTNTRSGMLWEVERILKELNETNELPQILLMENVPQVKGTGNVEHFNKWQEELIKLGYRNYHKNLIATDYGVPQTRKRTFMISILGDYNYDFPTTTKLNIKLNDLLEKDVDKKYYLTQKQVEQVNNWNAYQKPFETMEKMEKEQVCPTLTTRSGAFAAGMVLFNDDLGARKLIPKEFFRIMGVKDEDFENIAKNQSEASLYHLAGDSIVVDVLMAIFKQLL